MGGDFNAELGPGNGVERVTVGPHSLIEWNKRGDWMKQWLMIQNFTALNTMYRKTLGKQTTYRSPKRYRETNWTPFLIKRRHLKYSKDAEANDMIHMGSDHRCVMATFVINAQWEVSVHRLKKYGNEETFRFEERYQELEEKIKQEAASAKSNPKQNEDGRTGGTTEAEAEKRKGNDSSR